MRVVTRIRNSSDGRNQRENARLFSLLFCLLMLLMPQLGSAVDAAPAGVWSDKLDSKVRFYQTTELGALIVGTEKSLYAVDGESGEVLWRRKNVRFDETDVAPIIGTDLLLLSLEKDKRAR